MAREFFNMDRAWRFHLGDIVDGASNSHADAYASCKAGGTKGIPSDSFDDSGWREVHLPHDYLIETPFGPENDLSHGYKFRDNAWYRKCFTIDERFRGQHFLLCFDGLAVTAEIYLNGSLIGRSSSAYAELSIDITDRIHFGAQMNVLAVFIDGLTTEGWWYEGAGIYRHVRLFAKDPLHIAHNGLWIKPVLTEGTDNDWTVEVEVTAENSAYDGAEFTVRTTLWDGDEMVAQGDAGRCLIGGDEKVPVRHALKVKNPHRWDVEDPHLYRAVVELLCDGAVIDEDATRFGFRTISASVEEGFLLNGRKLLLKGTCNHQDHAGVGVAVPDSIQYYRVRRLKEMGTNAYRCSHNMPSRAILDACDELGLVVMDENRRFECCPEVLDHLRTMVLRDRNHPSVVMYSLFNEEPLQITEEGRRIYKRMKSAVLKLDDTRLLTGAVNAAFSEEGVSSEMDIAGFNYNLNVFDETRAKVPHLPLTGAENNSAVTVRGCYKSDKDAHVLSNYDEEAVPWGQTIRETWKFVQERPYVGGIFIWTGFDYRGEPTPFRWPTSSSLFGIMDTCGFPKDSFYFNKACFTDAPMLHLLPHWNWTEGEIVRVMTVTNGDEVELFCNGKSLGRKKSDVCTQCEWQVPFEPGILAAKAYRGGKEVAYTEQVTAGAPVRVKLCPDRTWINNDGADTLPVNVCLLDDKGIVVPTADQMVHFTVEGDGKLLGVGNGDPNCHESDILPQRSLFAGWCQGLVQAFPGAKKLKLVANVEGLLCDEVIFEVKEVAQENYVTEPTFRLAQNWLGSAKEFIERPDPLMEIADNDMNSFLPVELTQSFSLCHPNKYRILRYSSRLPQSAVAPKLKFLNVYIGQIEIYVNGEKRYEGQNLRGEAIEVPLGIGAGEPFEVRLLLYMPNKSGFTDFASIQQVNLYVNGE